LPYSTGAGTTKIDLRLVPGHLRQEYDRVMPVLMKADSTPPAGVSPSAIVR